VSEQRLLCPRCKASLEDSEGRLVCTSCSTQYDRVDEVPVLLLVEAAVRELSPLPSLDRLISLSRTRRFRLWWSLERLDLRAARRAYGALQLNVVFQRTSQADGAVA
jgi:uncharacterized protein YbaR (Trm112 family)